MNRVAQFRFGFLVLVVCAGGIACQLKRPDTPAGRMIEPQLIEPQPSATATERTDNANASPVRLLDTQARAHIGRRILHQQPDGELTPDAVWWWSSAPDRYLDTALHLELASSSDLATGRVGQRAGAGRNASRVAARVDRRNTAPGGRRIPVHRCRPRGPHGRRAAKRARFRRAARRSRGGRGTAVAPPRRGRPDANGKRTILDFAHGHDRIDAAPLLLPLYSKLRFQEITHGQGQVDGRPPGRRGGAL